MIRALCLLLILSSVVHAEPILVPAYQIFAHDSVALLKTNDEAAIEAQYSVSRQLNGCNGVVDMDIPLADIDYMHRQYNEEDVFTRPSSFVLPIKADWLIRVGSTRSIKTFAEASKIAKDGDVVLVDEGEYINDISIWRQNDISIIGEGKVILRATKKIAYEGSNDQKNGKAIIVTRGDGIRIINIAFTGAKVTHQNGAGIRHEGGRLWVCGCEFYANENGILAGGKELYVDYSRFDGNGIGEAGKTHHIYHSSGEKLVVHGSEFINMTHGHHIKSRVGRTIVQYSWLDDQPNSTTSYLVDSPNGGELTLIGNFLRQGADAENASLVNFGTEGIEHDYNQIEFINNSFVNLRQWGNLLQVKGNPSYRSINNAFFGNLKIDSNVFIKAYGNVADENPISRSTIVTNKGNKRLADADKPVYQIVAPLQLEPRQYTATNHDAGYKQY